MPALVYPSGNFVPFTKILSSEVNGKFNAITTLLNTTKLDSTNVQLNGLTRDRLALGTSNHVVINDVTGNLSSEATLATSRGGLGFAPTLPANPGDTIQVDSLGTSLVLTTAPVPPSIRVYSAYTFG